MDFCYLDDQGYAAHVVGLGVDAHWEMVLKARELQLTFFERFREYYQDAHVEPAEFDSWSRQLRILLEQGISDDLRAFLQQLEKLIGVAAALGKPIEALAD